MSATYAGSSSAVASRFREVKLGDINLLDVGNTIQIGGAIWAGNGKVYLVPLPDEDLGGEIEILRMDAEDLERFLNQTDVLNVQGPAKTFLRKSQRQIDQHIAWRVFERDEYRCRYCGIKAPLTVDHVILWEEGGATVEDNLVSACRKCNKTRGNMEYGAWLESDYYKSASQRAEPWQRLRNKLLLESLKRLKTIVAKPRSR